MALKLKLGVVAAGVMLALLVTAAVLPTAQAAPPSGSVPSSVLSREIEFYDPNYATLCNDLARRYNFGAFVRSESEPATGRPYRGGTSIVRIYKRGECHTILRNGVILHGPHIRQKGSDS